MKKELLLAGLCLSLISAGACAADFLADRHVQKGLQCPACHKETPPAQPVQTAQCQTCHGDYAALAARTAKMKPTNVHDNHLGELDCVECHGAHKEDKLACDECHQFKFTKQ